MPEPLTLNAIIKRINVKNNDTDSYVVLTLEVDINGLDLTALSNLSHKALTVALVPSQ